MFRLDFDRHAHLLQERLVHDFRIEIRYKGQPFVEQDYDLIHPLGWTLANPAWITQPAKWITGIRSHVSWEAYGAGEISRLLRLLFGGVYVVSRRLETEFRPFLPEVAYLPHGVDSPVLPWDPGTSEPGRLRLGWAGNPEVQAKGFDAFILPLGRLPGVELVTCAYGLGMLDQPRMRDFYETIDAYVCASITEGSNNSLLEAAAMARSIVTTDNGTVPEFLEHGVNGLIVE